jgi:hypothetical protein
MNSEICQAFSAEFSAFSKNSRFFLPSSTKLPGNCFGEPVPNRSIIDIEAVYLVFRSFFK